LVVERRKYTRYLTQENAFAALGDKYSRVGKIKNIALGGMAFEYIVGDAPNKENATEADIFMVGNVFHLHNIPCRIIYDFEVHVPHVKNSYVKILTTNRCGLQFGSLPETKMTQLSIFLEVHAVGYA
jgi:hypothetical protein